MGKFTHKYITRFIFKRPLYSKSLVHIDKINFMTSLIQKLIYEKVKGNIAEVGVYRGGTLFYIGKKLKELKSDKTFYAVDTFEGHPYTDTNKEHFKGRFSDTDFFKVLKIVTKNNFNNVKLIKGNLIDVTHFFNNNKFCFVHLDVDLYRSYKECLEYFIPRMIKGGIIFFDDYNTKSAKLCKKAVNEIIPKEKLIIIPTKQAYWINQ